MRVFDEQVSGMAGALSLRGAFGGPARPATTVSPASLIPAFPRRHLAVRRAFDISVALAGVVVALPAMLLIALAVKTTSHGPVLFRQERVGRGRHRFQVLKFRTMAHGTHDEVHACPELQAEYIANGFKLPGHSDRITKVGKVLRKTSLDELPQLFNVLKGDMSIVGIRPLVPMELAQRSQLDQDLYARLRPGLTGLWQISGRSTITEEERYALDRHYVAMWTPMLDVRIAFETPAALLRVHHAL